MSAYLPRVYAATICALRMLKPKTKGLFVDISEFSILAARTSSYKLPMVIEEIAELPIKAGCSAAEIREFFEGIVDFRGASYYVSRCGIYPEGRFVRFYEAESVNKAKDQSFLVDILKNEFNVDSDANNVAILDARDGSDFDLEKGSTRRLVFCGAPSEALESEQDLMLENGI